MNKNYLYMKDWMDIHPYKNQQPTDAYFLQLANQLYPYTEMDGILPVTRKKLCVYAAAYLEDIISELGLWQAFVNKNKELYEVPVPFYDIDKDYIEGEINKEDIQFILWNTFEKMPYNHSFISPKHIGIDQMATYFFNILAKAYEEAPENEFLNSYMKSYTTEEEAEEKLNWLFGHTYLTEPSVQKYEIPAEKKFNIPCGPTALFLYEWIMLLKGGEEWKLIDHLFHIEIPPTEEFLKKNKEIYDLFTAGTNGESIVYLDGYEALHKFLTQVLKWPDDENHTLPQMKGDKNFLMMCDQNKGILLAKNCCEWIADPLNPMYNPAEAETHAFKMLVEETVCPPDLLKYVLAHHYIPDAQIPSVGEKELVQMNADFIARHSLLYYYRGD